MARQLEQGNTVSAYSDRLLKLVPAEFVTVYVAVTQTVQSDLALRQPVLLIVIVVFMCLIPVYLYKIQSVDNHTQVILTTLSFVIWTYTLGDAFEPGTWIKADLHYPTLASVALLVWTGLMPLFVRTR